MRNKAWLLPVVFISFFLIFKTTSLAVYDPTTEDPFTWITDGGVKYVKYSETVSGEEVAECIRYYNMIPESIRRLMLDNEVYIYIVPIEKSDSEKGSYTVSANFSLSSTNPPEIAKVNKGGHIVYFAGNDPQYPEQIVHEAGHELDFLTAYVFGTYPGSQYPVSSGDTWIKLYNDNLDKLKKMDNLAELNVGENPSEGLADAFRLYCTKPEGLKSTCPDVYQFVKEAVESFDIIAKDERAEDLRAGGNDTAQAKSNINIRKGPGIGYERIITIPQGEIVTITGPEQAGWCPIETSDGVRGYLSSEYLIFDSSVNIDEAPVDTSAVPNQTREVPGPDTETYNTELTKQEANPKAVDETAQKNTQEELTEHVTENEAAAQEAHTHTYDKKITKTPTCTEQGIITYTCTICGDSYTEPIPTTEHIMTPGSSQRVCSICGAVLDEDQNTFISYVLFAIVALIVIIAIIVFFLRKLYIRKKNKVESGVGVINAYKTIIEMEKRDALAETEQENTVRTLDKNNNLKPSDPIADTAAADVAVEKAVEEPVRNVKKQLTEESQIDKVRNIDPGKYINKCFKGFYTKKNGETVSDCYIKILAVTGEKLASCLVIEPEGIYENLIALFDIFDGSMVVENNFTEISPEIYERSFNSIFRAIKGIVNNSTKRRVS